MNWIFFSEFRFLITFLANDFWKETVSWSESFEHGIPELSDSTQQFAKKWSWQKGSSHFQSVHLITRGECSFKVRKQVFKKSFKYWPVKKFWLNRGHLLTNKQLEKWSFTKLFVFYSPVLKDQSGKDWQLQEAFERLSDRLLF